ncbi:UNVERIFIED_CONTAM: hypothetical protein K2H54_041948 [Gekko kuhli]
MRGGKGVAAGGAWDGAWGCSYPPLEHFPNPSTGRMRGPGNPIMSVVTWLQKEKKDRKAIRNRLVYREERRKIKYNHRGKIEWESAWQRKNMETKIEGCKREGVK